MGNRDERTKLLTSLLDERILVLDGAMGTMIQQRDLAADDFGGPGARRLQREPRAHSA